MKTSSRSWEDLPDHIIQQIRCSLWDDYHGEAAQARSLVALVRTSLLSKSWLNASSTSPALSFQHPRSAGRRSYLEEDKFVKLVDDTLLRYCHHNLLIRKFRLVWGERLSRDLVSSIHKWIKIASQSGLMDLDLMIRHYTPAFCRCTLSREFLDMKSLKTLKLSGDIEFRRCDDDVIISCHSLVYINLYGIKIDEHMIHRLFYKCPLIHTFILYECHGFKSIRLANALHLRKFRFSGIRDEKVEFVHGPNIRDAKVEFVDAPTLCSFSYCSFNRKPANFCINSSQSLTCLNLYGLGIDDVCFNSFVSKFPFLEDMVIDNCSWLKNIEITFDSLVKLTIRHCDGITEVNIKAPKLLYFDYRGKMSVFSGIYDCPMQLKRMTLCIEETVNLNTLWFLRLREVLEKSCESDVSVIIWRNLGLSIDFDIHALGAAPFQQHGLVKLEFIMCCMDQSTAKPLVDAFLFASRPKYFTPKISYIFLELLFKNLIGRTNVNCCTGDERIMYWHHYLKDMKIGCWKPYNAQVSREDDEFGWRPMSIPWQDIVRHYIGHDITFKLDWI